MPRKPRPEASTADSVEAGNVREIGPRRCAAHGAALVGHGAAGEWCPVASAVPVAYEADAIVTWSSGHQQRVTLARRTDCPAACPVCRAGLTWDGGCDRCYGTPTPSDRATWTFPGDRYEADDPGHYRLVARGPRPVASEADAAAALAEVKRALAAQQAHQVPDAPEHSEACECRECTRVPVA